MDLIDAALRELGQKRDTKGLQDCVHAANTEEVVFRGSNQLFFLTYCVCSSLIWLNQNYTIQRLPTLLIT